MFRISFRIFLKNMICLSACSSLLFLTVTRSTLKSQLHISSAELPTALPGLTEA